MDVVHILLGHPWLYDHDVIHQGRENTCSFRFKGILATYQSYERMFKEFKVRDSIEKEY